jgi:serine/threonine protein kinase
MWKTRSQQQAIPPTDANLNNISLEYPFTDVARASRNFSQASLLGKGSYGSVYRGILKDGTEVAIKVLNTPKESGFKEEVTVLSKFRHPNLVILMGFSRNGRDRYLIYELLPGGDLCDRLQKDPNFDYRKRMTACLDAALGLSHLHNASSKVFHRDIKSQNILLDRNGTAKVADFGLAVLVQPKAGVKVEQCAGTLGYADPLYISSSVVTEGSEVYSFGMVLLEVLTGKPPAIQGPSGQVQYVYGHLRGDYRGVLPMVDWRAGWPPEMAQRIARLAVACIEKTESKRPVFVDIVARLRDLVNRTFTARPPVQANLFNFPALPRMHENSPLLRNQAQLEEALRRVNGEAVPPKVDKKTKWNPFDVSSDDPESIESPPVIVQDDNSAALGKNQEILMHPRENSEVAETKSAELSEEMMKELVHKAVADFDEELRAISVRDSQEEIERAMNALFPSNSTVGSPPSPEDDSAGDRRKEAAKHLLAAGFTLEQTREALKRTTSVEAAVEWIVEQKWL